MALAECLDIDDFRERVKIYATDVDEEALAFARQATYDERALEAVPPDLREKYFEPAGSKFVFSKALRRSVIFGRNDLVKDAPISHVDLLACRNTLMYFNAETQAQILNRMHFALRPEGVLFLGKAEMLLGHSAYFKPIELKRRFFRKVADEARERRPVLPGRGRNGPTAEDADPYLLREAALMSSASAQIVLDDERRLALVNNRATSLFGLTQRDLGRLFQDLDVSYRPVELRSQVDDAIGQRRAVWIRDVELARSVGEAIALDIQIVPLSDDRGAILGVTIIFNDVTQSRQLQQELEYTTRQLETAYEELQSTNEELETTNEELQSTVEELETTNEELQSTVEELETMNEELQSMNDELHLSNDALRDRQEQLDRLNRFMSSVLSSMNSGVAVVDTDLHLLAWNNRAEDLWGVRTDEAIGRHLLNLDIGLPVERLREPLRTLLGDADATPAIMELDAVNRRGHRVKVKVTLTHIVDRENSAPAAMLVMDVVESGG
jgi:two-component system CheB/CheR fusion protein